ncbi:MAG: hypothetical protein HYV02_00240 [Deltaproteobacteria bacterium]|nr:hypothetical protein [Deltaproteobacteria bacterium]
MSIPRTGGIQGLLSLFNRSWHFARFRVGPEHVSTVGQRVRSITVGQLQDANEALPSAFTTDGMHPEIVQFGSCTEGRGNVRQPIVALSEALGTSPLPETLTAPISIDPSPYQSEPLARALHRLFATVKAEGGRITKVEFHPLDRPSAIGALKSGQVTYTAEWMSAKVLLDLTTTVIVDRFGYNAVWYMASLLEKASLSASLRDEADRNAPEGNEVLQGGLLAMLTPWVDGSRRLQLGNNRSGTGRCPPYYFLTFPDDEEGVTPLYAEELRMDLEGRCFVSTSS